MENSIRIDTGMKRVIVNDDEARVIEFNPEDIVFAEQFYGLIQSFEEKEAEYKARFAELDANKEVDQYGLLVNTPERIGVVLDLVKYMKDQIDTVFGPGTSQAAFGNAATLGMFEQFFSGILPFIQTGREKKVSRYKK